MPELPEVETVRRSIEPAVVGRRIEKLEILTPGVWLGGDAAGWLVKAAGRRGKYLIFELEQDSRAAVLIVHLRMTGRLLLQCEEQPPARHTHVRLWFGAADGQPCGLVYIDPRRFGRLWLLDGPASGGPKGLAELGPEPLGDSFGPATLAAGLHGRGASLKALLLDQTLIAGLGNIYADESLFASGLNPARRGDSLSEAETARLAGAVVDVLSRAIACQGTTLRDYADGWNRRGSFQDCLMVYGRAGQPCRSCGTIIQKTRLAGRSTCWCPVCQPSAGNNGENL